MEIQLTGQRLWSREHIEKVTRQMFGTLERNRNARIEKLIEWTDAGSMSLPAVAMKKRPVKFSSAFYRVAEHAEAVRLELEKGDATLVERGRVAHEAALKAIEPHVVAYTVHPESAWTWPKGMTAGDIMASATPMVDAMPLRKGDVVAVIVEGRPYIGDVIEGTIGAFVLFRAGRPGGLCGVNLTMERLPQARLVYRRETVESAPCAPEEGPDILAHSDGVDPLGRAIERPAVDAPRFGYGGESMAMGWAAYEG